MIDIDLCSQLIHPLGQIRAERRDDQEHNWHSGTAVHGLDPVQVTLESTRSGTIPELHSTAVLLFHDRILHDAAPLHFAPVIQQSCVHWHVSFTQRPFHLMSSGSITHLVIPVVVTVH